jgi:hypothetical protein
LERIFNSFSTFGKSGAKSTFGKSGAKSEAAGSEATESEATESEFILESYDYATTS